MVAREVEVKYRCPDHDKIRSLLLEMKAVFVGVIEQVDTYFQHPCRDFVETDEALRIRRMKDRSIITYKGPKEGGWAKTRIEVEVEVSSADEAAKILEMLGFKPVAVIHKRREIYHVDGVEVSLDVIEGVGKFVELEDKGGGLDNIKRLVKELGLIEGPIYKSYLELYLENISRK